MSPLYSGAATLPRGFRYHENDYEPRTPEPSGPNDDFQPPSPPRPRFRLKRRNVTHLTAPTQQFLASVAAADMPIPSIEEPQPIIADEEMLDTMYPPASQLQDLEEIVRAQKERGRTFSPPKTPAPGAVPSLSPRRYPDWTIDSAFSDSDLSPECESSRPSTARSTQTSASAFSRFSLVSDDLRCGTPETESMDLPKMSMSPPMVEQEAPPAQGKLKLRKARWTKATSQHLWATYVLYQQDPKVTPFRVGKSGIPPHGVCLRVAREAKRSWRGGRALAKTAEKEEDKSGSNTPTAETSGVALQWPHTTAATRAHLRELCRIKAAPGSRPSHFMASSPTPFGRTATRFWNRRSAPARSPSVFSAHDIAMSLTMATSETMKPDGPLAQLTSSKPEPIEETPAPNPEPSACLDAEVQSLNPRRRLGSPFRSYGPSSSGALLAASLHLPIPGSARPSQTVGPRRNLQSPVRLTRSRSNTQKRRTRQMSAEPRKTKRPSLAADIFQDPSTLDMGSSGSGAAQSEPEFSSTLSSQHDERFVPRTNVEELFGSQQPIGLFAPLPPVSGPSSSSSGLAPPNLPPPRLGSPFSVTSSSFSFPNRFSNPDMLGLGLDAARRPFATMQQPQHGEIAGTVRPNLASRLAYVNQRLREFRTRDHTRRRSESPL